MRRLENMSTDWKREYEALRLRMGRHLEEVDLLLAEKDSTLAILECGWHPYVGDGNVLRESLLAGIRARNVHWPGWSRHEIVLRHAEDLDIGPGFLHVYRYAKDLDIGPALRRILDPSDSAVPPPAREIIPSAREISP